MERAWPDGGRAPKGSVVVLSCEDSVADTTARRFDAAGADDKRVHIVRSVMDKNKTRRGVSLKSDLDRLEQAIRKIGDVKLVIIDPITAYMGEGTDSHKTADVRAVLDRVNEWADRLGSPCSQSRTRRRARTANPLNWFIGSQGYIAIARFAFVAIPNPEDAGRNLMLTVKANIGGKKVPGWAYTIESWERIRRCRTSSGRSRWTLAPSRSRRRVWRRTRARAKPSSEAAQVPPLSCSPMGRRV